MLTKYNLKMPHAVFSGEDTLEKICDIFAENHVKRLAVFSDKGIEGAGLLDFPMARVKASGVAYTVLDDLPAEPSYMEAQKLVDQCKEYGADFIMAVGGGSVQESIRNGVEHLEHELDPEDIVIIHDGIRPLPSWPAS